MHLMETHLPKDIYNVTYVTKYHIEEGRQPIVSRLHVICLSLGILSTVMGCAAPPPPMAPLRATLAPAAPAAVAPPATPAPADLPPVVAPLPSGPPPAMGTSRLDVSHPSSYERKMDEEEHDYRRRRSAQEQEQEQRYQ